MKTMMCRLVIACCLAMPVTMLAQSSDNMQQDSMKKDDNMKHDDMKKDDGMKHDDMKQDDGMKK